MGQICSRPCCISTLKYIWPHCLTTYNQHITNINGLICLYLVWCCSCGSGGKTFGISFGIGLTRWHKNTREKGRVESLGFCSASKRWMCTCRCGGPGLDGEEGYWCLPLWTCAYLPLQQSMVKHPVSGALSLLMSPDANLTTPLSPLPPHTFFLLSFFLSISCFLSLWLSSSHSFPC